MWKVKKVVKDSKAKVKDMELNRETAWDVFDKLKEILGNEELLDALSRALGTEELIDNMKYIIRVYDINLDDEIEDSCGKKKKAKDACGKKKMKDASTFYGVPGTKFIWHGEWSDPEVAVGDYIYNYYDLENTLWDMFKEECDEKGEPHDEDKFPAFVRENFDDLELDAFKRKKIEDACGKKTTTKDDRDGYEQVYSEEGEPDFGLDVLNYLYKNHKEIKYVGESTLNGKTYLRFDKLPDDVKDALKKEFGENISFTVARKKTAPEIEYPVVVVRAEETKDACGKKTSTKDAKVKDFFVKMDLEYFEPWSGAVETWNKIVDNDKLDEFEAMLDDLYPDGLDKTDLNDLLWFDDEWVLESLGLSSGEDEEEEISEDEE